MLLYFTYSWSLLVDTAGGKVAIIIILGSTLLPLTLKTYMYVFFFKKKHLYGLPNLDNVSGGIHNC